MLITPSLRGYRAPATTGSVRLSVVLAAILIATTGAPLARTPFTNLSPPPPEEWGVNYAALAGSGGTDWIIDVNPTPDGGYIAAGFGRQGGPEKLPALTRLDAAGNRLWTKLYDGGHSDWDGYAYEVITTVENGQTVYVAVGSKRDTLNTKKGFILKVDANGNVLAGGVSGFHYFNCLPLAIDPNNSSGESLRQTPDGGFIATGGIQGTGTGLDMLLIRLDAGGNTSWCKNFSGQVGGIGQDDIGLAVRPTFSSGVSPCGEPQGTFDGYVIAGKADFGDKRLERDAYIVRTDPAGTVLWRQFLSDGTPGYTKIFNETGPCTSPTGESWGLSVEQIHDGHFVVAAEFNSYQTTTCPGHNEYLDADAALVKLDNTNGAVLFAKNISHFSGDDFRPRVKETPFDLGFVVLGTTADPAVLTNPADEDELLLVRTDGQGNVIWRKPFLAAPTLSNANCGFGLAIANDGGYVVGGNNGDDGDNFVFGKLARDEVQSGLVGWYGDCYPSDLTGLNNGTPKGTAPTCPTESKKGIEALNFLSDDWIQVLDSPSLHFDSTGGFGVEMWIKTGSGGTLVDKSAPGFTMTVDPAGLAFIAKSGPSFPFTAAGNLLDGAWHHVAAGVVRGAGSLPVTTTVSLYIDGSLISIGSATIGTMDSSAVLRIGALQGPTANFHGVMDEVKILNHPLTPLDVSNFFAPPIVSPYCGPLTQHVNNYCIAGTSDAIEYSWWIDLWDDNYGRLTPEPFNLHAAPVALNANSSAMASSFASSINAVSPGTATSTGSCFTLSTPVSTSLWVGSSGGAPGCRVTASGCTYNPTIMLTSSSLTSSGARGIPTLGEWGLVALVAGLLMSGSLIVIRR